MRRFLAAARAVSARRLSGVPSLVSAVEAAETAATKRKRLLLKGAGLGLLGSLTYDAGVQAYARIILGAAATEQLFMQGLEGEVELELILTNFSSKAELRGDLTPVERPAARGSFATHRNFSLLKKPPKAGGADRSDEEASSFKLSRAFLRSKASPKEPAAPVASRRLVSVFAPARLSALVLGLPETSLYCRKSRCKTEYFTGALPGAAL